MKKRNIIAAAVVTMGMSWAFSAPASQSRANIQNQATEELGTYRNAKNEICETMNGKVECLSERAYQKEQVMKERRARSNREEMHDRVD